MPNFAAAFRDEITRLVRKELRKETEALKLSSARYRSEISGLKRRVSELEKTLARTQRTGPSKNMPAAKPASEATTRRFSASGFKKMRERLDFSAAEFGKLLEVSPQTIYNWEGGTTRPRPAQIEVIAAIRSMGKREVAARLAAISPA